MRLPADHFRSRKLRLTAALCGATMLAGCSVFGGDGADLAAAPLPAAAPASSGPAADYPVVVGEPYRVGNTLYTPVDTLNYDEVGYLAADSGAMGYTGSHHTMPLPSYVEVTDLSTGKTVLVRLERRGPMQSNALVALSPAAMAQLGSAPGASIRVRRVSPPEDHRAMLRGGQAAPIRMDTPESLLVVLRRKLPAEGSASLQPTYETDVARRSQVPAAPAAPAQTNLPAPVPAQASAGARPLPSLGGESGNAPVQARPVASTPAPRPVAAAPRATPANGGFVVQAAAFGDRSRAERVARVVGGTVTQAGRFWRVRTGPFATRGEAEASLAKVRAAGYADARIFTDS